MPERSNFVPPSARAKKEGLTVAVSITSTIDELQKLVRSLATSCRLTHPSALSSRRAESSLSYGWYLLYDPTLRRVVFSAEVREERSASAFGRGYDHFFPGVRVKPCRPPAKAAD